MPHKCKQCQDYANVMHDLTFKVADMVLRLEDLQDPDHATKLNSMVVAQGKVGPIMVLVCTEPHIIEQVTKLLEQTPDPVRR